MQFKAMLFLFVFLILHPLYSHAEEVLAKPAAFPDELMFNGKPIDPSCFWNITENIQDKCPEPEHDGSPLIVGEIKTKPDGSIGYSHVTDRGTAEFFYKYLGKTDQGFLIQTNYTHGGTGHWGFVKLYKREANRLVFVKEVLGGDGAYDISYENGNLYHSYGIRDSDLFVKYAHGTYEEAWRKGFNGCARCYAATVKEVNGKIINLELADIGKHTLATIPECFKSTYAEAISTKKIFTEEEVRKIFSKFDSVCRSSKGSE